MSLNNQLKTSKIHQINQRRWKFQMNKLHEFESIKTYQNQTKSKEMNQNPQTLSKLMTFKASTWKYTRFDETQ